MTLSQSVSSCFSKYATFSGRASRSEYWWWQLFVFIVVFVIVFIVTLMNEEAGDAVGTILQIAFFLPNLAVAIRRCHDTNHSGWWVLCPIYNIVLMFLPGDAETNEYGAPGE